MNKIFEAIENDNFSQFKEEINLNKLSLDFKDNDGWNPLDLCIQYELNDYLDFIISNSTSEQINEQSPQHPLILAIETNNVEAFDKLVKSNKLNYAFKDKAGENLLFNAFYSDNSYYFKELIKEVNPYEANNNGISAFSLCIENNKNEYLIDFTNPVNLSENYNEFFIKKAIQNKNHIAFDMLIPFSSLDKDELFNLASGFDNIYAMSKILDSEDSFMPGYDQLKSLTELMCFKYSSDLEKQAASNIIDYLFTIGLKFNQFVNKSGQSAWMLAIENDNMEVFSKLVKTSESVNLTDAEEHSPLMYAIEHNKLEFVSLLLKKKANSNHVDRYKNTPLIKAVKKGNREIVKELLKYPTHINEINQNKETALNLAVKFRKMDIVSDLIWAGGELSINPAHFLEEKNVFHFNMNGQYEKLLNYDDEKTIDNFISLSQLGFNINQTNPEGDNFLIHFIKNGFLANFKTLLRCSVNSNHLDINNNTAAMCAMNKNSNSYIESLFAKFSDIDLNIKNTSDENIYELCIKHQRSDRMTLLIKNDNSPSIDNARKALFFLAKHGELEQSWEKIQDVLKGSHIKDELGNSLLMLCVAGDNKKDYDFLLKNNLISNLKEPNNNNKNIYQLIEELPKDKKIEYKQSLIYFSQLKEEQSGKKPS